jgi:hypothetical protein
MENDFATDSFEITRTEYQVVKSVLIENAPFILKLDLLKIANIQFFG